MIVAAAAVEVGGPGLAAVSRARAGRPLRRRAAGRELARRRPAPPVVPAGGGRLRRSGGERRPRHPVSPRGEAGVSSRPSTPRPATPCGATTIRPATATTSGSTRGRGRCPSSPTGGCTRSARRASFTPSISKPGPGCGRSTPTIATACARGSSGRRARPSSRTAGSSPTSAAAVAASSPSTPPPATSCGPRPTTRPATRPPAAGTFGGRRLALVFTRTGLVGLDPASGEVRFELRWRSRLGASVNAATPLVLGDSVFISASYGTAPPC